MHTPTQIKKMIWEPSPRLPKGAWLWWFWLFFIHDENTSKTGKCRQIMILWSVKNDKKIKVNDLLVSVKKPLTGSGDSHILDGAPAAWYFDGEKMHDEFILEQCKMTLNSSERKLEARGNDYTSFEQSGENEYKISIRKKSGGPSFEFICIQKDFHKFIGPTHGSTKYLGGALEIEGTRIERLELSGEESDGKKKNKISGSAYFQKILLAIPPTQWYWGIYHFADGSIATYMQAYMGRSAFKDNYIKCELKLPTLSMIKDILIYHAPSKRVFEGHDVSVYPRKIGENLYEHEVYGSGKDFSFSLKARAYSHSCWSFEKCISILPVCSTFKYNEYPALITKLEIKPDGAQTITLENGWGNMENSWGFLL